jgi:hypothetical protein
LVTQKGEPGGYQPYGLVEVVQLPVDYDPLVEHYHNISFLVLFTAVNRLRESK